MTDSALLAELAEALRPFADMCPDIPGGQFAVLERKRDGKKLVGESFYAARRALSKYDARRLEAIRDGVGL